jgi:hypothetical protein
MTKYQYNRFLSWILAGIACAVAGLALFQVVQQRRVREGEQLERAIARMSLGIGAGEAERLLGGPPMRTMQQAGVLMNSVTMLTAENTLAQKYGKPEM